MFNNSLENILKAFTKVQRRLDAFVVSQEFEAELQEAQARLATERGIEARNNAAKARKIYSNISKMLDA